MKSIFLLLLLAGFSGKVFGQKASQFVKVKTARGAWLKQGKDEAWIEGQLVQAIKVKNKVWIEFEVMSPFKTKVQRGQTVTVPLKWTINRSRCDIPECNCTVKRPIVLETANDRQADISYLPSGLLQISRASLNAEVKIACSAGAAVDPAYFSMGLPIPLYPSPQSNGFDEVNSSRMETLGSNLSRMGITFTGQVSFPGAEGSTPQDAEVRTFVKINKWTDVRNRTPIKNGGTITVTDLCTIETDPNGEVEFIFPGNGEVKIGSNSRADFELDYSNLITPIKARVDKGTLSFKGNSGNIANNYASPHAGIHPRGTAYSLTVFMDTLQAPYDSTLFGRGYRYSVEAEAYVRSGTLLQVTAGSVSFFSTPEQTTGLVDKKAIAQQLDEAMKYLPEAERKKLLEAKQQWQPSNAKLVLVKAGEQSYIYTAKEPSEPTPIGTPRSN